MFRVRTLRRYARLSFRAEISPLRLFRGISWPLFTDNIYFCIRKLLIIPNMNDQNKPLPPLPETPEVKDNGKDTAAPPPIPHTYDTETEEKPYRRALRYGVGIVLALFALIGVVTLYSFVHDVLMDDHEGLETQNVNLEQYVINEPPVDIRRSHVRMKPGSHPEAGYIADESVLIREREEDTRFREQNGTPVETQPSKQKPVEQSKPTEKPRNEEPKPTAPSVEPAQTQPAAAPAKTESSTAKE